MEKLLEFTGINKAFPGVQALKDVSFEAKGGRVLALMGENGAGKSTLLKIMSADQNADSGEITLNGEKKKFASPHHAIVSGISVIYQERQLIPNMSVMENIFSGDLPINKLRQLNVRKLKRQAQELIDKFELPIDPTDLVGKLPVAYQQMVEIMKAYRRDSDVIAFDEPTAPLTDSEIVVLFRLIQQLKDAGKIIIYVSHRLSEVFQITDDIVVLKDGQKVAEFKTSETTEPDLIKAMVGRDIGDTYANLSRNKEFGDLLLEVKDLVSHAVYDINFTLRKGEILGLAGLIGAGRTEVVRALFGADNVLSGEIILDGKQVKFKSPKNALDAGLALCPEDRKEQGLVLLRSIKDNVCLPVMSKLKKGLFLDRKKSVALAQEAVEKYSIKTHTVEKVVMELSGGNQQKVILGRCTSSVMDTKLLILDEPTKGIDVGTKAEIYQMICDFAKSGMGVILISSELTEVINLSDTIIVMRNGTVSGKLSREEATEERVLTLAFGN